MADFVKNIQILGYFRSGKGVSAEDVQQAEQALGVHFADEYREYLTAFGIASANGHEFTGLGTSPRLDVVAVTQRLWEMNPSVPRSLYVVEELNIDDMVAWQSATGEMFLTVGRAQPVKTAESLSQYAARLC